MRTTNKQKNFLYARDKLMTVLALKEKIRHLKGNILVRTTGDKQANNQPEYTEEQPNRTSPNTASNPK